MNLPIIENPIFTTLTDFIFAGFISITFLQMISSIFTKKAWWDMDVVAINIVRAFSIIYLGLYIVYLYEIFFGIGYEQTPFINKNMVLLYYFGKPVALLIFIIGLSLDKVKRSKIFRGIASILLFIPYFTILSYLNYNFFILPGQPKYWSYDLTLDTWRNLMYGSVFILFTYLVHYLCERISTKV